MTDSQLSYDDLPPDEQAARRAQWKAEVKRRIQGLNLTAEFDAAGVPWVDTDDDGRPVVHRPDGATGDKVGDGLGMLR